MTILSEYGINLSYHLQTTAEEKELWLHTQLKLRRTLEKMEDLIRPGNVEKEVWSMITRRDKWFSFFEGSDQEDFGFTTFVTCAKSVSSDSLTLARFMNRLYLSLIHISEPTRPY